MKHSKKLIALALHHLENPRVLAEEWATDFLDDLYNFGALKDPPQPREFNACITCGTITPNACACDHGKWIKVREVLEEDE